MANQRGLLITSWVLILAGILFYILAVAGLFFGGKSPPLDLGVYSVTIVLVLFGIGGLLLRWSRAPRTEMQ